MLSWWNTLLLRTTHRNLQVDQSISRFQVKPINLMFQIKVTPVLKIFYSSLWLDLWPWSCTLQMDGYKVAFDSVDIRGREWSIIFEPVLGCCLVEGEGTGHSQQGEYLPRMRDKLIHQNQADKPVPLSRHQHLHARMSGAATAAVKARPWAPAKADTAQLVIRLSKYLWKQCGLGWISVLPNKPSVALKSQTGNSTWQVHNMRTLVIEYEYSLQTAHDSSLVSYYKNTVGCTCF
jgi:hypothetical protein